MSRPFHKRSDSSLPASALLLPAALSIASLSLLTFSSLSLSAAACRAFLSSAAFRFASSGLRPCVPFACEEEERVARCFLKISSRCEDDAIREYRGSDDRRALICEPEVQSEFSAVQQYVEQAMYVRLTSLMTP